MPMHGGAEPSSTVLPASVPERDVAIRSLRSPLRAANGREPARRCSLRCIDGRHGLAALMRPTTTSVRVPARTHSTTRCRSSGQRTSSGVRAGRCDRDRSAPQDLLVMTRDRFRLRRSTHAAIGSRRLCSLPSRDGLAGHASHSWAEVPSRRDRAMFGLAHAAKCGEHRLRRRIVDDACRVSMRCRIAVRSLPRWYAHRERLRPAPSPVAAIMSSASDLSREPRQLRVHTDALRPGCGR